MTWDNKAIEKKWKEYWRAHHTYKVEMDVEKPKYYVLDMFPYPSGAGLHVGHPLGYIASDIYSRYKRMKGFNVLHPMGYDAFGLPAEQYAIQTGIHPQKATNENIARYREQLDNLGFSYDWSREIRTCAPDYYKWTQWIFTLLFGHYYDLDVGTAQPIQHLVEKFERNGNLEIHAHTDFTETFEKEDWKSMTSERQDEILMFYRLAYRQKTYVNWCEALGTVLANDEVKDGFSERGGHPVIKRPMLQWSLRITAYAERLLNDLQNLDWSDAIKTMQQNWIGRSEGAMVHFKIEGHDHTLEIFTTRPDTIFGATFMVIAPEHDLVKAISTEYEAVDSYMAYVDTRSERDRVTDVKTVTGAFTGAYALHPITGRRLPIYISEYVLKDYGTGAIMAVPSDDERDRRFAQKFGIEVIQVVDKTDFPESDLHDKVGTMINSDFLNGLSVVEAIAKIISYLEENSLGSRRINYKLRDANFSRQRYWGEPFPVIYTPEGRTKVLPLDQLPLELPFLDDIRSQDGAPPLSKAREWISTPSGLRETDTMPGYAGSSWYFFRYMDAHNENAFAGPRALEYWKDVDLYVGGTEHAVGHLMYSRFWTKFLFDLGYVKIKEPFKKLVNQGMIQGIIEHLYLKKEKDGDSAHFVSARLVKEIGNFDDYLLVPIHIDFVSEYGSDHSYLNQTGIEQFLAWRPEFKGATFECVGGIYKAGVFQPYADATDSHLETYSEVGKMSKSKYNVINPDDVVETYGADVFRMYEMFLGPIETSKPWDINGIDGVAKFLRKYLGLFLDSKDDFYVSNDPAKKEELKILHQTIKKIEDGIERFAFNTCISAFMIAVNELKKMHCNKRIILESLNMLMAPFAPFVTEEINARLGQTVSIHLGSFPVYDETMTRESEMTYPVSINGKKRGEATFPMDADKDHIESQVIKLDMVRKWMEGRQVRRIIVVPARMINIVLGD